MTNFLTTLRALDAAATPGLWMRHKDPRLPNHIGEWTISRIPHQGLSPNGTFFVAHIVSMGADNANDADLLVHLRNRAAAIAGCVEAAKDARHKIFDLDPDSSMLEVIDSALAALEGE